jgi:hypothetical protein
MPAAMHYLVSLAVNVTGITVARSPTLLHNYSYNTSYVPYISPTSSHICNKLPGRLSLRQCDATTKHQQTLQRSRKSHRLPERRHICLLLYPPHIPSWVTSNNSQRLLLLVVKNIPMNITTRQIEGNSNHCSEKRDTSRKTRNGLVGSLEILSAFLAEAICINRASLSLHNTLNCQVTFHHL